MKSNALIAVLAIALAASGLAYAQKTANGPSLTPQDYLDIQQLVARYAHAMDTGADNGNAYADLFAADGEFVAPDRPGDAGTRRAGSARPHRLRGRAQAGARRVALHHEPRDRAGGRRRDGQGLRRAGEHRRGRQARRRVVEHRRALRRRVRQDRAGLEVQAARVHPHEVRAPGPRSHRPQRPRGHRRRPKRQRAKPRRSRRRPRPEPSPRRTTSTSARWPTCTPTGSTPAPRTAPAASTRTSSPRTPSSTGRRPPRAARRSTPRAGKSCASSRSPAAGRPTSGTS